jgi:hypothetical protein
MIGRPLADPPPTEHHVRALVAKLRALHLPRRLPLQVVADPDAPEAVDAPRHVDVNVRVGIVDLRRVNRAEKLPL